MKAIVGVIRWLISTLFLLRRRMGVRHRTCFFSRQAISARSLSCPVTFQRETARFSTSAGNSLWLTLMPMPATI